MKQQNAHFNGTLNYLAGVSSPTAANLTVQGLTNTEPSKEVAAPKPKKPTGFSLGYLAGVSSPSAGNFTHQGIDSRTTLKRAS